MVVPARMSGDFMSSDQRFLSPIGEDGHIRALAAIEADVLDLALDRYGSISEVCRRLKIGRSTFYRRLPHGR